MELSLLREKCARHPFVLESFKDRAGTVGLSLLVEDTFHFFLGDQAHQVAQELRLTGGKFICFDSRRLLKGFPELGNCRIIDMKLILGGEASLFRVGREFLGEEKVFQLKDWDQRLAVHLRACRTAKMDLDRHSVMRLVPPKLVLTLCRVRCQVTMDLWAKVSAEDPAALETYETDTWPFAKALYEVEENGIAVDMGFVKEQLKLSENSQATMKALRSIEGLEKDGFVYSQFTPVGGKTGRIRIEGGFNSMAIPHGPARKAIVSRWTGGSIVAFDFNAIDYRCIVSSIKDENFRNLYKDCPDFHTRTASFLFGSKVDALRRDIIKQITYVYIYGGTDDTLSRKTGLSVEKVRQVLEKLDEKMLPIKQFKLELAERSRSQGYVELPCGRKMPVEKGDHDGKILGLYAQGYSSVIFQAAFMRVRHLTRQISSKVIFTVHDELVMDFAPHEFHHIGNVIEMMQGPDGKFRVKCKKGKNYGEATDG